MAETIAPKPLKPTVAQGMEGLSLRQMGEHYTLYQGYVNKVNEIRHKLETADRAAANQTYSEIRALKVELSFALNGVKLHELYFDNLGGQGGKAAGRALQLIERDFGSYEKWEADFRASGVLARGWVIMAYDEDGKLYNYIADAHNSYGIWGATPILIMDTYEHAYLIDYGVRRPPYIDAFMKNIAWDEVNRRLEKAGAR